MTQLYICPKAKTCKHYNKNYVRCNPHKYDKPCRVTVCGFGGGACVPFVDKPKKWKPRVGDTVWTISYDLNVYKQTYYRENQDGNFPFQLPGVYRTKKEARAMANKIKELLKNG